MDKTLKSMLENIKKLPIVYIDGEEYCDAESESAKINLISQLNCGFLYRKNGSISLLKKIADKEAYYLSDEKILKLFEVVKYHKSRKENCIVVYKYIADKKAHNQASK